MAELDTHEHDVLVIGAGGRDCARPSRPPRPGAGGLICKSLLGKAHT